MKFLSSVQGQDLEVGYRAQVPYVRIKLFADRKKHAQILALVEKELQPHLVGTGELDLAQEALLRWPLPEMSVVDELSDGQLMHRLYSASRDLQKSGTKAPLLRWSTWMPIDESVNLHLHLKAVGEEFVMALTLPGKNITQSKRLPYKIPLLSERGRRAAGEWLLYWLFKAL